MDPERGHHPIYSEDGTKAVIANGEIYNYPALRRRLAGNHRFRTKNDSEVLIHLYEEYGPKLVDHIEGMFAFCIVNGDEILLGRDAIGIKPLYIGENEAGEIVFASELKAVEAQDVSLKEFPPGSTYRTDDGFATYYSVPYVQEESRSVDEHVRNVRRTLETSVCRRLMSDVPLGCFLSGGLDSSVISALVAREAPGLHTFSVGLPGSDDLKAAREVAEHIGSNHHAYVLDEREIMEMLPRVIYHLESFDQDLVRSAVPNYFTARMASDYVKVILTGEGADELFGGYTYYKTISDERVLHQELIRSVRSLHDINLQRVDRMTMAHSVEGRVPFLDLRMIDVAQRVPAALKLRGEPPMEKWVLRKACEDLLPPHLVWRRKAQFDEGSGTAGALPACIDAVFTEKDAEEVRKANPDVALRSAEEAYYFSVFCDVFADAPHVRNNVARWADRPDFEALASD
jgi:asparagine synthase (glutamine-hydrolysing)